ncbi:AAA family ATPase [Flammeovirga sp. EKP202]|uniref:AAA family ATPase n=1 Tax=Flammeovirga sp. EKP202 TaxID=2770592 RepID=UPI00165F6C5B|nr:AAA family ATPase [Flammeovirga sp. EKP202]MBD0402601.1 AAA family ATPase [Flammeovirga sp. EKP202]
MQKYIISGAAGTGKTTLINAIDNEVETMPEASRQVIMHEQLTGGEGMPWKDVERFSQLVFQKTITQLQSYFGASFCDRSLIDTVAYLKFQNKSIPEPLLSFPYQKFYHKVVFFALPWEKIYITDLQRPESFSYQKSLSNVLKETYLEYGFELIYLPFDSVENRMNFVFDKVCMPMKIK